MGNVTVMDHPLMAHKISILRDKGTTTKEFRDLVCEIATLIAYEATRDLPLKDVEVETPLVKTVCKAMAKDIAVVPILRAGLGMVEGVLTIAPFAKVGHIGLYRDHETLEPVEYYCKLPPDLEERIVFVVDPMLATGGSASAAIDFIKKRGATSIKLLSVIAAPEGIERIVRDHPDVQVYVGQKDERLNENGYILPGLGDAGDRLFGTI